MFNAIVVVVAVAGMNATEPPTDAEVMRTLPRPARVVPFVFEAYRDNVTIVKERVAGAEVRLPLLGVTVVTSSWQCTTRYAETMQVPLPFPAGVTRQRVQVTYIDKAELAK
jgi:hypothetical protein